jgi:23S rRNA (uracil1939-C5)-methyltransferase
VIEHLTIARLGKRGGGVVDSKDGPIYVPYALPGETVEVEGWQGHSDRRRMLRLETASADRIAPICPHFGICGGCAVQHLRWDHYRAWKRDLVVAALAQVGIAVEVGDLVDAHGEGRRRVVLHARRGTHDVLEVGFAALHSHQIAPIDRCPVAAPGLDGAIEAAWAIAEALRPTAKPLDIHATATETGLDIDVRGSGPLAPQEALTLARIADTHRLARLTRHGELIVQRATPTVTMGRASVALPPAAFLQATAEGEAQLSHLVLRHTAAAKAVADLFSGVGPFALRLAERARVVAADLAEDAVAALRQAAQKTPGLKPVIAHKRDLFRRPFLARELNELKLDALAFDPPRQGADAQAHEIAASAVPIVVAVSCNAATFARDAATLVAGGYQLTEVTPVDQFRYSYHVETVARFVR